MHKISLKPRHSIIMAVAVLSLMMAGCKGRKASDMVPSGDTVEVVIGDPVDINENPDTIQINDTISYEV